MPVDKKCIDEFDAMFDLPSDNKDDEDNEQSEEYGHSTESIESFDVLAKEVAETMMEAGEKGFDLGKEDPHDIVKDVCSKGNETLIVDSIIEEMAIEESVEEDGFFDEVPVKEEVVEDTIADTMFDDSDDTIGDTMSDDADVDPEITAHEHESCIEVSPKKYGEIGDGDDKIEWMLESPSAMYNSFYQKKRDLLFHYMVGGQIEYKRWTQELEEAKVTIRGEVFDHQLIIDQMEAVQQYRERVKSIHVRVNNQYFTFKRFVEMMRGFMARIEYLKPVIRQEGLIMEHMRDLELYYARLEALHDSATKTEKMLAAAFDTLSRKCTICMELKPAERVDLKNKSLQSAPVYVPQPEIREESNEFDEFDDLPSNASSAPTGHKTGAIGWGDI